MYSYNLYRFLCDFVFLRIRLEKKKESELCIKCYKMHYILDIYIFVYIMYIPCNFIPV